MTRSTTLIPVSPIRFIGELPSVHVIENRLQLFLRTLRALKQDNNLMAVKLKVVKSIRRKTRQTYSAEEKIRIVLAGLRGEESIAVFSRNESNRTETRYFR